MNKNFNVKLLFEKKYRTIVLSTTIFSFFLISLLFFEAYISYSLEKEKVEQATINYAFNLEESLNSSFQTTSRELDFFSEVIKEEIINKKEVSKSLVISFLKNNKEYFKEVDAIRYFNLNGDVIANSEEHFVNYNVADRDYFKKIIASSRGELVISQPVISRHTKRWCIVFAKGVFNNNKIIGVVTAILDLKKLSIKLANLKLGKRDIVAVFTLDGINVARVPFNGQVLGRKMNLPILSRVPSSNTGNLLIKETVSPIDNQNRLVAKIKLKNFDYNVFVGAHKEDSFATWTERTFTHLGILSLILIGFALFLLNHLFSLELLENERKLTMQSAKLSAVGEMAAGIAHEINNPLTIIQASVGSLKKQLDSNEKIDIEYYNKRLDKINHTVVRISKIIKGLRNFTRDSFNDPFERKSVEAILNDALELTSERMKNSVIDLRIDNIEKNIIIECREVQITQVLVNLINNSYDAVLNSDERWIEIVGSRKENIYQFKIIDCGYGVGSKIKDKIMDPFYTTKSLGKGTGLGLSISKSIIESHNGKLYIDSNAKHTTFIIELPRQQTA